MVEAAEICFLLRLTRKLLIQGATRRSFKKTRTWGGELGVVLPRVLE
jgi:hypothetical protein